MHNGDMRILVDMDGVLADFNRALYEAWEKEYPRESLDVPETRIKSMLHEEPQEKRQRIRKLYHAPGFYRSLTPIKGGIEAVREMAKRGHGVFICSSPVTNTYCISEKIEWVMEYLGDEFVRRTVITKDKTLVKGDILIDDWPDVTGAAVPEWEHVVFDQPYNKHITDKRRITWDTYIEVLAL
jgi:5'-nucleotidase